VVLVSLTLGFASLAVAERGLHDLRSRSLAADGALWIWGEGAWEKRAQPAAFLAACDFALTDAPAGARLSIVADEEYLVYVNARLIGSNRYRDGAPLDVYEVADLLQPGANRIAVELRSGRGAGGLLAMVESGGARHCVTGPAWRFFRRRALGVVRGWTPLVGGEAPRVWGLSPTGRWGAPAAAPKPRLDRSLEGRPSLPADVQTLSHPAEESPARVLRYDWGEEVYGFLRIGFDGPSAPALLYLGTQLPDPRERSSDEVMVTLDGESRWRAAAPARFRYLVIAGGPDVQWVDVLAAGPELVAAYPPALVPGGLLGIEPPPLRAPVEDEIRRQLEGFASIAGGEKP
jgi:hypothetical protein